MPECNDDSEQGTLSEETLALFFTFGVSLQIWADDGILDREIALYDEHAATFDKVYLFTYGGESDLEYEDLLPDNVQVVPKSAVSNSLLYSFVAPLVHRDILRDVDVVKTNQMLGSWTALLASLLFGSRFVVRTGYILTKFYNQLERPLPLRLSARILEHVAYNTADGIITSSPHGYEYVEDTYHPPGEHRMIPNYIETDVFRPIDNTDPTPGSIVFVGRLAEQKNLFNLLEALNGLPYSLTLIGDGPLEDELKSRAASIEADVTFTGNCPNQEIPRRLNEHEAFVLPSYFEGMPKSLLEAMSCGVACIGTDVNGTSDVITHGETGLLCETDSASLRKAIEQVLSDDKLRTELGSHARQEIQDTYSLKSIVDMEQSLYTNI